ncbi:DgyrCDS889 [Dimorphilus gyrociliatus]|uniref:DgyrCDS889 n=1 Tax=Dimorphilus gyrociliatus TaxID=2664684 RepID=A0A7I8VAG6_9ANNE|nr:DgyrCDS889 [Dimorphilus gyrociliatus]
MYHRLGTEKSLFTFTLLILRVCYGFIEEKENIARSLNAYQSYTMSDELTAVNAINSLDDYKKTSADVALSGWWATDLNGFYQITEICFWNKEDEIHFANFKVYAETNLLDEDSFCFEQLTAIHQKFVGESTSYYCKTCNCQGSFVRIAKNLSNQMRITDVKIRGTRLRDSDETLIQLTHSSMYSGEDVPNINTILLDGLFSTIVLTTKRKNGKSFLRVDLNNLNRVKMVIFDTDNNLDSDIVSMKIYVKFIPDTFEYDSNYLLGEIQQPYESNHKTHVVRHPQYLTGSSSNGVTIQNGEILTLKMEPTVVNCFCAKVFTFGIEISNAFSLKLHLKFLNTHQIPSLNANFIAEHTICTSFSERILTAVELISQARVRIDSVALIVHTFRGNSIGIEHIISPCNPMRHTRITIPSSFLQACTGIGFYADGTNIRTHTGTIKLDDVTVIGEWNNKHQTCFPAGGAYSEKLFNYVYFFMCRTKLISADILIFNANISITAVFRIE